MQQNFWPGLYINRAVFCLLCETQTTKLQACYIRLACISNRLGSPQANSRDCWFSEQTESVYFRPRRGLLVAKNRLDSLLWGCHKIYIFFLLWIISHLKGSLQMEWILYPISVQCSWETIAGRLLGFNQLKVIDQLQINGMQWGI